MMLFIGGDSITSAQPDQKTKNGQHNIGEMLTIILTGKKI
jgi:hypothetical protein